MKRFVYRPDVEAYIWLEDAQRYIDITDDIIDCSVTRKLNAISTASLTVQNRDNRYMHLIKPMDRIAIWMTRTKRMLNFTGYIDEATVFALYPKPIKIEASCTLKLLQNTYFDPGLPFMQQFFAENGDFLYDPTTGNLLDAELRFGNFDQKGGLATALRAVLTKIGGFPDEQVHITNIPKDFLTALGKEMQAAVAEDQSKFDKLLTRIERLMNTPTRGNTPASSNSGSNDFGNKNADAATFRRSFKKHARPLGLNPDQQYNAGVIWGVAKGFKLPDQVAIGLIASSYSESNLVETRMNEQGSGAAGLFQLLGQDWYGPDGWLAKAIKLDPGKKNSHPNPLPRGTAVFNPVYNTRAFLLANRDTNYRTINNARYADDNLPDGYLRVPIHPNPPLIGDDKPYHQIISYWERPGKDGALKDYGRADKIWPYLLKTLQDLPDAASVDNTTTEYWITQNGLIPKDIASTMTTYQLYRSARFRTDGADPGPAKKGQTSPLTRPSLIAALTQKAQFKKAFGYDPDNPSARKSSQKPKNGKSVNPNKGPYIHPFYKYVSELKRERVDMGVDFLTGRAGRPIYAIGDGKLIFHQPNPGGFGPSYFGYSLSQPVTRKISGAGQAVFVGHSDLAPGLAQAWQGTGNPLTGGTVPIKKGQIIGYTHGGTGYGGKIGHVEIGWASLSNPGATLASANGHVDPNDHSNTPEGLDFDDFLGTLSLDGGASLTGGTSGASTAASGTDIANNANLGFFSLQLQSSDFAESTLLQGKRALANDISLFEWIQTMATAGGRSFCSLPNGDFYAFFPDYFRWFGDRTPYFLIEDIEIIDINAFLSDRDLRTHVFTAGSRFTDQVESFDRILSQVASVQEQTSFNVFINRGRTGANGKQVRDEFDPIAFLKRFGARPEVYDMPQVRHPVMLWMAAWTKFAEMWAGIYMTEAEFTFMPELLPGGLVSFGNRFTMYVEEVRHDVDRESGFRTSATLKAPSGEGKTDFLGPTLLTKKFPLAGHTGLVDGGPPPKRAKPKPKLKPTKKPKKKK